MKILVFSTFLFLFSYASAQESLLGKDLSFSTRDFWAYMREERNIISSGVFFGVINFRHDDVLPSFPQVKYVMRLNLFPFIFEGYWFSGNVHIRNPHNIPVYQSLNNRIEHSGWSFSLSICPLPYINSWSEVFVPYIGIGYQASELGFGQLNTSWQIPTFKHRTSHINSSSWIFKIGCNIYLRRLPLSFVLDFERSFGSRNKEIAFYRINLGIFLDLRLFHYNERRRSFLPR